MALWLRDAFVPLVASLVLHLAIIYFATLAWSGQSLWREQRPSETLPLSARLLSLPSRPAEAAGGASGAAAQTLSAPAPELAPFASLPTLPSLPELGATPAEIPPAAPSLLEAVTEAPAAPVLPRYRHELLRESLLAESLRQQQGKQLGGNSDGGELAEVVAYRDAIALAVERSWRPPPSVAIGIEVELAIRLSPAGEVLAVSVARSSGDVVFDASARAAVRRLGHLALLQQLSRPLFEQYFRRFRLLFRPQVERRR